MCVPKFNVPMLIMRAEKGTLVVIIKQLNKGFRFDILHNLRVILSKMGKLKIW